MNLGYGYFNDVFDPKVFQGRVDLAVEALKDKEFDAIAVRGNSGTIFGGALSLALKKPLLLVRKDREDSHGGGGRVEGDRDAKTYVFVDDFIATGATFNKVRDEITSDYRRVGAKCVGVYTYSSNSGKGFESYDGEKTEAASV